MDKSECGVHESHCCVLHGCKYGDEDCPVVSKETKQIYVCETCYDFEEFKNLEQLEEHLKYLEEIKNWKNTIKREKEKGHNRIIIDIDFFEKLINR